MAGVQGAGRVHVVQEVWEHQKNEFFFFILLGIIKFLSFLTTALSQGKGI